MPSVGLPVVVMIQGFGCGGCGGCAVTIITLTDFSDMPGRQPVFRVGHQFMPLLNLGLATFETQPVSSSNPGPRLFGVA